MYSSELRILNQTRESLLLPCISVIDAQVEPLRVLKVFVEGLAAGEQRGIWLKPLRGIPAVPRIAPFDLVFLDKQGRVLRGLELTPAQVIPRPEGEATSALILPSRTLASSKMQPGDVLAESPMKEKDSVLNRVLIDESFETRFDYSSTRTATLDLPTPVRLLEPELTAGSRSVLFRRFPQPRISSPISISMNSGDAIPAPSPARIVAQPRPEPVSKSRVRRPVLLQRAAERVLLAMRGSMTSAYVSATKKLAAVNRIWFSFKARDFKHARGLRRSPSIFEEC